MHTLLTIFIDLEGSEGDFYGDWNPVVSCCPYTWSEGEDFSRHRKRGGDRGKEALPGLRKLINTGGTGGGVTPLQSPGPPAPRGVSRIPCFPWGAGACAHPR